MLLAVKVGSKLKKNSMGRRRSKNKKTKCPIDAHCHCHCRRDPRITKDGIEVRNEKRKKAAVKIKGLKK